jgi:catechol 2,3-dioxygenase-like lactoylglutathione lyase family enzyme
MFERYNEKARRTIFFARFEASTFGSPYIEAEFLLLGLLREDPTLSMRFLRARNAAQAIRKEIEQHRPQAESISTSKDLPLSNESKHVLAYAAEEAELLGHSYIGTEHLLLGILREKHSFAATLLQKYNVDAQVVRTDVANNPPGVPASQVPGSPALGFFQLVLKVTNLEASIDFYKKLGFTVVGVRGTGTAVLTNGGCHLKLDQNVTANQRLSFLSGDIFPAVSRLQSAGLQFDQGPQTDVDGSTTALLRDPDGNIISLVATPDKPR